MSAGALRCLAYFRWAWKTHGPDQCWPKLRYLAEKLKTSVRSLSRWIAELRLKNCVKVVTRGRRGALFLPPVGVDYGVDSRPPSLYELQEVKTKTMLAETLPVEKENQTPEPLAQEQGFSPTEKQAVAKAVESHRRPGGEGFVCSGALLRRLERIAGFYQFNGFQVASELERVRRQDLESRSRWPEKDGWFCAVLEARLKRRERKPVQREERGGAVFLGWSAEELRALDQGVEAGAASVECDPKPVARDLPVAQPKPPERRTEPGEREWCDTGALISEISAGKSLVEATGWKRPESLEALHRAVDRKAEEKKWPGAA